MTWQNGIMTAGQRLHDARIPAAGSVHPAERTLQVSWIAAELRSAGHEETETQVLPGSHAEGAVVNVVAEHGVESFSRIPLVSPMAGGSQMFVNHPQVSAFLRGQIARFSSRFDDDRRAHVSVRGHVAPREAP